MTASAGCPRSLTVCGLVGVALLVVGSLFDLFAADLNMLVYAAPMAATELLVGVWLLVRPATPLAPPPARIPAALPL